MAQPSIPDKVVLRYWSCRGRAQALADFLFDREVPFVDERVTAGSPPGVWVRMRKDPGRAGPFAALPVLQWGDDVLAETLPIASFLNQTLSLPSRAAPSATARHDMLCSAAYLDVSRPLADLIRSPASHPGTSLAKRAHFVLPVVFQKMRLLSLAVGGRPDYFGGETPAVADFFVFEAMEELAYLMGPHGGLLADALPELTEYRERLRARPAMARLFRDHRHARFTGFPDEPKSLAELESLPWRSLCAPVPRWQLSEAEAARFRAGYWGRA
ncbi:MAG: glutathione S-transferase family protein [Myxococcales bacterium]|nr:glutathione S-transferase family protein [Myxococcales bacterium]MDD9969069.1 glutathione S-transferase family protein [Myxococcales bacterium]